METIDIIIIMVIILVILGLGIALIYYWIKIEDLCEARNEVKKPKIKPKTKPLQPINIESNHRKDNLESNTMETLSPVSDNDFDRLRVANIEKTETKSLSTVTCKGSLDSQSPSTVSPNDLRESFGCFTPNNFRSPKDSVKNNEQIDAQPNHSKDTQPNDGPNNGSKDGPKDGPKDGSKEQTDQTTKSETKEKLLKTEPIEGKQSSNGTDSQEITVEIPNA